jgi:hypothetical protein
MAGIELGRGKECARGREGEGGRGREVGELKQKSGYKILQNLVQTDNSFNYRNPISHPPICCS